MNGKASITIFTDPMMGLSYEMEPVMERLETAYRGRLELRHCMSLLVPDIHRFMTAEELALPEDACFAQYNRRLATIYKSEERISDRPICMDGFHLFDAAHTTTKPLCLAYKAAQIAAPERADVFLSRLRIATCVECRQTTRWDVIYDVARESGIDAERLRQPIENGQADAALADDLRLTASLGIHSLPAYLLQYQGKAMLLQTFSYDDFVAAIHEISDGQLTETH